MGKFEDILKEMDKEEIKILMLCFAKPKVIEALRIYHCVPGFQKSILHKQGKKELTSRGFLISHISMDEGEAIINKPKQKNVGGRKRCQKLKLKHLKLGKNRKSK